MATAPTHLIGIGDLADEAISRILAASQGFEADPGSASGRLDGKIACMAFFEPSTRTRLSFEAAANRLGARVVGFSDPATTSSSKGETLEDTVRMLCGYADIVVMRHPKEGAAQRAAKVADVPIVNAGDGPGEHPTQTLVDLYTLQRHFGRISGLKVALIGDLRYGRTVHSLLPALNRLGARAVAVAAPGLELPGELARKAPSATLEEAASDCDVLYVTRVQRERLPEGMAAQAPRIDADLLRRTKSNAIVLHPLPRVDEIAVDVDALGAAKYFDQARNGVPVRMAVLASLLESA